MNKSLIFIIIIIIIIILSKIFVNKSEGDVVRWYDSIYTS